MRYLFIFILVFCYIETANANFLNKKPEGLLFFEDSKIHKKNPLTLYFDFYDYNQLKRNSFKEFDSYAVGKLYIILKYCDQVWGGLPKVSFYSNQIKDFSKSDFKSFLNGYSSIDLTWGETSGPIKQYLSSSFCAPQGTNKDTFLKLMDEYLVALKLIVENKGIKENELEQINITTSSDNASSDSEIVAQKDLKKNEIKEENAENQVATNITLNIKQLENESQLMITDIKEFSGGNKSINTIEFAQLFIKFKKSISSPWSEQTAQNYSELLAFMQTVDGFNQYVLNKKAQRENELENRVNEIVAILSDYTYILQSFLIENLGSEKTAIVIELSEKITKLSQDKNLNDLTNLQIEVKKWLTENDLLE